MTQAPPAPSAMPMLTPDMDFDAASRLVLEYLATNVPMALWGVSRVENGRQTFVHLDEANGYGTVTGDGAAWEDTFCIHMAAGAAPTVAPDAQSVPAYAAAKANATTRIGAYGGAPIVEPSGALFGVICGIDPERKPMGDALAQAGPLLSLLGQLLSMVLAADRVRDRAAAAVFEATLSAETDALTGLYNRRAWDRVLTEEEDRFSRFADPTVAVVLDLDMLKSINDTQGHAAGDTYIRLAGGALSASVTSTDVVARLGGDEFGGAAARLQRGGRHRGHRADVRRSRRRRRRRLDRVGPDHRAQGLSRRARRGGQRDVRREGRASARTAGDRPLTAASGQSPTASMPRITSRGSGTPTTASSLPG